MLVIRLQRTGRENNPTYRLVVSEKARHAKKGTLEILGHFLPSIKEPLFKFEKERVMYWIGKGAKPSDTVARLLKKNGLENSVFLVGNMENASSYLSSLLLDQRKHLIFFSSFDRSNCFIWLDPD